MNKVWKFKSCDDVLVEKLERDIGDLPRPLLNLLVQRGCTSPEKAQEYMNPVLSALDDPFDLPGMKEAVQRIRKALAAKERITVFGDYDSDGICSTSLLVRVLREMGGAVSAYIPNRLDDGYGLTIESLDTCVLETNPSLIVTVDCGTTSVEAVETAAARGIDVVVTDHHEPGDQIPDAVAVVNPKLVLNHPASILAGVGVAFKLSHALVKAGREEGCAVCSSIDLRNYLDFVAVATITDMVPLQGENRALVRSGLQRLEDSVWPGWNALKKRAGINGPLESWHAGFAFGPRINAAGRIGRADAALELFLTERSERADELAEFLEDANRQRQIIEKSIVKEAVDEIDNYFDERKDFGLVVARDGWHTGVIGIVASRLVQRYGRPVAVIGMDGETGRGSCRSIDGFSVLESLDACADLLIQFGGHAMAAGIEVNVGNLDEFSKRFNAYAGQKFKDVDLRQSLDIDHVVQLPEVDDVLLAGLRRIGPFGQDNPEPVWAVLNTNVEDTVILKDKHLKMVVTDGKNRCDAIGFNMAEKLPSGPVDVAFTLQENVWNGRARLQMNIKDIRSA